MNANDKANRMLRAKAMECISMVGMAVGKEKFGDDAKQVCFHLFLIHIVLSNNYETSFSLLLKKVK